MSIELCIFTLHGGGADVCMCLPRDALKIVAHGIPSLLEWKEVLPSIKHAVDDVIEAIVINEQKEAGARLLKSKEAKNGASDDNMNGVFNSSTRSPTVKTCLNNKETNSPSRSPSPTRKDIMAEARLKARQHTENREYEERWARNFQANQKK